MKKTERKSYLVTMVINLIAVLLVSTIFVGCSRKNNDEVQLPNSMDDIVNENIVSDSVLDDSDLISDTEKDEIIENTVVETNGDFLLKVQTHFTITGNGTIVGGIVERGSIKEGDIVNVKNMTTGEIKSSIVSGIEIDKKMVDIAKKGDDVGILLKEINKDEISQGDIVFLGEAE